MSLAVTTAGDEIVYVAKNEPVLGTDLVRVIDFDRMKRVQTTFVVRDYRHVESDVVLTAPVRIRGRSRRRLVIYILIEHQSEPDPLMPLRTLEYVVQIFKFQTRNWSARHRSFARLRLEPVLPVVFYMGARRWDSIGTLTDLIELGERFVSVTPLLQPLFLNLATIVPGKLESEGGFLGSSLFAAVYSWWLNEEDEAYSFLSAPTEDISNEFSWTAPLSCVVTTEVVL